MSIINKQGDAAIHTKLTTIGRQLIAYGSLTFKKFSVGDSEVDYQSLAKNSLSGDAAQILRPVDNQPGIKFPIPKTALDGDTKYAISVPYPTDNQVVNAARERGFFTKPTANSTYKLQTTNTYLRNALKVTGGANGGTQLTLEGASNAATGDYVLVQWFTPNNTNSTATVGDLVEGTPGAFLWYKIIGVGGNSLTVDRPAPNFGGGSGNAYIFPGGDSIKGFYGPDSPGDYWDSNLLSFNAAYNATYTDVPVWNLTIIYDGSVPGATSDILHSSYPSKSHEGLRSYFNVGSLNQPVGVVHYSNYTVDNFYGEGFYKDTFVLELPTVMYHGQTTNKLGLTLKAGGTKKTLVSNNTGSGFSTPYYDLRDGSSKVVGKVFIDLKVAIIEDAEILSALSYASNRNWTLPPLKSANASRNSGTNTIWLTYRFAKTAGTSAYSTGSALSYGYQDTLHCQNLVSFTGIDGLNFDYVEFKFDLNDLRFMIDSSNAGSMNGAGFVANRLIMMAQITELGAAPRHDRWIEIDYTPQLQNYSSFSNGAITKNSLSAQIYRLTGADIRTAIQARLNNNAQYYQLGYMGAQNDLTFTEEVFLLGNIKTDIQATSYQTRFSILLNNGEFSTSRNPTWTPGTPVYISEVGIYDDKDNLVAIGKLMNPLLKDAYSLRFITADLDF